MCLEPLEVGGEESFVDLKVGSELIDCLFCKPALPGEYRGDGRICDPRQAMQFSGSDTTRFKQVLQQIRITGSWDGVVRVLIDQDKIAECIDVLEFTLRETRFRKHCIENGLRFAQMLLVFDRSQGKCFDLIQISVFSVLRKVCHKNFCSLLSGMAFHSSDNELSDNLLDQESCHSEGALATEESGFDPCTASNA
jgi:hypothetical protein